jgi:predicted membrane protein
MSRFTLDVGAANLEIEGAGNASPEKMIVQGGAGKITLDLTGDWANSADIEVTSGVGQLDLRLPDDVGVRVNVQGGLSNVEATGLSRSGEAYVNNAYGEAEIELNIEVTTGVGQVDLKVAE